MGASARGGRFFPFSAYAAPVFFLVNEHVLAFKVFVLVLILLNLGMLSSSLPVDELEGAGDSGDSRPAALSVSRGCLSRSHRGIRGLSSSSSATSFCP